MLLKNQIRIVTGAQAAIIPFSGTIYDGNWDYQTSSYDGDCDPADNDPDVKNTILRHGNCDYLNQAILWDPDIENHDLPDSYYLSAEPEFFGTVPGPPIGSDVSGYVNQISAEIRFNSLKNKKK